MRTSFFLTLIAATALFFTGCATKSTGNGMGDGAAYAGDGAAIDPNDPSLNGYDPNDPNAGAYDNGKFEDLYTRVTDSGLEALLFSFDSYVLPAEELAKAEAAAQYLFNNPKHVMIIEGHCDERGTEEYNRALGERRAIAVENQLRGSGIDLAGIRTVSYGEDKPAVSGSGESAWSQNRRAVLWVGKAN